jgi:hypothetical protein
MADEIKAEPKGKVTLGCKFLDLTPKPLNVPRYTMRLLPQSGSNFVNLGVNAQQEATFEIPTKVMSLPDPILSYTRTIADQGAGNYSWTFADTIPELYQIQLYSRSGQMIADIPNVNVVIKAIKSRETKLDDFLSGDTQDVVRKSDVPAVLNPIPVAGIGSQIASTNYTKKQYLTVSPVGVNVNGAGACTG